MTKKKSKGPVQGKQKKKVWGSKQVLASPFAPVMPSAKPETQRKVLEVLLSAIPVPFAKRPPRPPRADRMEIDRKPAPTPSVRKPARLVCGLNEVTRGLERENLDIVVVCRDITPALLVSHIPVLCFAARAPLVIMPGDGTDIGTVFGTKRVVTFAVRKRPEEEVADPVSVAEVLLKGLRPMATTLDFPWLAAAKNRSDVPEFPKPLMIPHRSKMDIG